MLWANTNAPDYLPPAKVYRIDGGSILGFGEADGALVLSRLMAHYRLAEDARLQAYIAEQERTRAEAFSQMLTNEKASRDSSDKAIRSAIPFAILGGVGAVGIAFVVGFFVGKK